MRILSTLVLTVLFAGLALAEPPQHPPPLFGDNLASAATNEPPQHPPALAVNIPDPDPEPEPPAKKKADVRCELCAERCACSTCECPSAQKVVTTAPVRLAPAPLVAPVRPIQPTYDQVHAGHNCPRCGAYQNVISGQRGSMHSHTCGNCGATWWHSGGGHVPVASVPRFLFGSSGGCANGNCAVPRRGLFRR